MSKVLFQENSNTCGYLVLGFVLLAKKWTRFLLVSTCKVQSMLYSNSLKICKKNIIRIIL